jgi:hypothetical protein
MEINEKNCKSKFCNLKIHSSSEFNKEALRLKKEARTKGLTDFEKYPKFVELLHCKSQLDNEFHLKDCKTKPMPKQNTTKRTRCPNGFRFNKKTGMCEPKSQNLNVPKQTKSAPKKSQSVSKSNIPKRKRCPNGFKFNKKTGMCQLKYK